MEEKRNEVFKAFDSKKFQEERKIQRTRLRRNKREDEVFNKRRVVREGEMQVRLDAAGVLESMRAEQGADVLEGLSGFERLVQENITVEYAEICVDQVFMILDRQELAVQASSVLACVSSSEVSLVLTKWISSLVDLLPCVDVKVQENIYWILGNVALDSEKNKEYIMSPLFIHTGHQILASPQSASIVKKLCWCVSHCCKGKKKDFMVSALPFLTSALDLSLVEIYPEVLWALSSISESYQAAILASGALPHILKISRVDFSKLQHPAFRIIGNLFNASDTETEAVIKAGAIRYLSLGLDSRSKVIRQEAMWAISNLSASRFIEDFILKRHFRKIIDLSITDCSDIQKEAVWCMFNSVLMCGKSALDVIISDGILAAVCYLLNAVDLKGKELLLKCVLKLLSKGEEENPNPFVEILQVNGGKETIEELVNCKNARIAAKCSKILKTFFEKESDEMELVPTETFAF